MPLTTATGPVAITRVYLCAAFERQAEMRIYRGVLERDGLTSTARWLDMPAARPTALEAQAAIARTCVDDVRRADALVAFTEEAAGYWSGGRHVEVGLALALQRPVFVVGPIENVFHAHPAVTRCRDLADLLAHLGREEPPR